MRKVARLLAAILAVMAALPRAVWDGSKWIMRATFGPPMPAGAGIEESLDAVAEAPRPAAAKAAPAAKPDLGQTLWDWAHSRVTGGRHPAPDTARVPEDAMRWINSLTPGELGRLVQHGPARVRAHVTGEKVLLDMPICREPAAVQGHLARVGDRLVPAASIAPAPVREPTTKEEVLAILEDLIDDQAEPTSLAA